jgi:hypothetical protein
MFNGCDNTITITGEAAELRRFSAAHPPGHRDGCFGQDVARETIVSEECDPGQHLLRPLHRPGLTLTLRYQSVTAWSPPIDELKEVSREYPELRFELTNTFPLWEEGPWMHRVFLAGENQGRCRGELFGAPSHIPCPDNGTERGRNAVLFYDHWWGYCE